MVFHRPCEFKNGFLCKPFSQKRHTVFENFSYSVIVDAFDFLGPADLYEFKAQG